MSSARTLRSLGALLLVGPAAWAQPCNDNADPSVCGEWGPLVNLWMMNPVPANSSCGPSGTDCCGFCQPGMCDPCCANSNKPCHEVAHLTLVPTGPKQGWVLFWRADSRRPQVTYLWKPDGTTVHDVHVPHPALLGTNTPCGNSTIAGNVFCSGHAFLPDGRLVAAGADDGGCGATFAISGSFESWVFDPSVLADPAPMGGWQAWTYLDTLNDRRWYPSVLTLEDGSILIVGGVIIQENCDPDDFHRFSERMEILEWNGGALDCWKYATDGASGPPLELDPTGPPPGFPNSFDSFGYFPHLRLLSGYATIGGMPSTADMVALETGKWGLSHYTWLVSRTEQDDIVWLASKPLIEVPPGSGTFVDLLRVEENSVRIPGATFTDEFLIVGGRDGANLSGAMDPGRGEVHDIDLAGGSAATWLRTYPDLNEGRLYSNTVILADGSIITLGGAAWDYAELFSFPVVPRYVPELLDPSAPSPAWQQTAPASSHRLYHSVALLLPDGRVLTMGGEDYPFYSKNDATAYEYIADAQIYSPPYLFKGPRPRERRPGSPVGYNQVFGMTVETPPDFGGTTVSIGAFALIRPGSVTHAIDFTQLYVPVASSLISSTTNPVTGWKTQVFDLTAPVDGHTAPPGWYMLFAVAHHVSGGSVVAKIPSEAVWVQVL